MNLSYPVYRYMSTGLFLSLLPAFRLYSRITGKYGKDLEQRFGGYSDGLVERISGSPRVWMHAVSVGEIGAAVSILGSLRILMPDCAVILSTTTEQGRAVAIKKLRSKATLIYAPVDFLVSVRKALRTLKPDILVCLETELWPNWLIEARRLGIKTALVNGRISTRSIRGYLKIRPLMKDVLKQIDSFSMISALDAKRIERIGAPQHRIQINGNAKYDDLLRHMDMDAVKHLKRLYNVTESQPVFVAGSTRGPEESVVLDVYEKIVESFPETLLIIAPRHVNRAHRIESLAARRKLACQFRSDLDKKESLRTAPVVILDTMGELQATYGIASVIFCGGSLAPLGGQNILEAAVWGKPVLYGPSMEDFLDAKCLLEQSGGGVTVKDGRDLAEKAVFYLTHPQEADRIGRYAKQAVALHKGAAMKHARVIYRLLNAP